MHLPRMFRSARGLLPGAQPALHHALVAPPTAPAVLSVAQESHHLRQALTFLRNAAEQAMIGAAIGIDQSLNQEPSGPARQAEAAMKSLRALAVPATAAWIELTQALTVVVLAADMLSEGHLSPMLILDTLTLLHRNAERALHSLDAVYLQLQTSP